MTLKPSFELVRQIFSVLGDVRESQEQLKELRKELESTHDAMERMAYDIRLLAQRLNSERELERKEREKLALQLENALLRFGASALPKPRKRKRTKRGTE